MRFSILGPLEVSDDQGRRIAVTRRLHRSALALLLFTAGQPCSSTRLISGLWGDEPPLSPHVSLRSCVYGIRKILPDPQRLVTHPSGYLITVAPGELDLDDFLDLARRGRDALDRGEPRTATALLSQAVSLWREPPLSDLPEVPARQGILDQRKETRDALNDARLAMGEHRQILAELRSVVAADPVHEHAWAQLITALYRSGARAEALAAFGRLRFTLISGHGIDPGPELQDLHRRILADDPTLMITTGQASEIPSTAISLTPAPRAAFAPGPEPASAPRPAPASAAPQPVCQLPMAIADFTGRTAELHSLLERLSGAGMAVTVVSGMLGVGKTTHDACYISCMTSNPAQTIVADLYLRLSDFRDETNGDVFGAREARLRAEAERLGWQVGRVVIENDVMPAPKNGNGNGSARRPASAFKRRKITTPSGRTELRVYRPGFRSVLDDLMTGRVTAMLAEDLDRACRDPRDLEDLIDAMTHCRGHARSLSGSLTFTNGGTDSEITMARVMVAMGNKSSRDNARRVAAKRETLAADGAWGGGRRPFGYRHDPDAPKYRKTLIVVPSEAAEITRAAEAVLASQGGKATDGPLMSLARSLRERDVPTVTGAPWTAATLRDILLKPAVAGIAVHTCSDGTRTEHRALWPAILPRDTWEAVRSVLTDPGRRTGPGNAPRWLLSGIARCGVCDDGTSVHVKGGRPQSPGYMCMKYPHLRRVAPAADNYVSRAIIERLSRDDVADLLAPPPRPGIDAHALRQEAARLTAIGEGQARMHALGDMTDGEFAAGSRIRKARIAEIRALLAANSAPDPLAEFRGQADAAAVWQSLPLARKRAIVSLLTVVTILPAGHRANRFDPASIDIQPVTP